MGGLCAELDGMATYILRRYMAVWRNGIASDYDSKRHQEIAGSTPVSVIFASNFQGQPAHCAVRKVHQVLQLATGQWPLAPAAGGLAV